MKFSEALFKELRLKVEHKEIIGEKELEVLAEIKKKVSSDNVALGKLGLRCYDLLNENKDLFNCAELNDYLEEFSVEVLRSHIQDYHDGKCMGDYYLEIQINTEVSLMRSELVELSNTFFKLFGDEYDG